MTPISVTFPEKLLLAYARRFPIRRGKLRVVNKLWRAALCGRGTHRLAELAHGGFMMPCDLQEMLQRQYYFFGTYFVELEIIRCWERFASEATVVFDVGANAGIYSLAALGMRPDATVYAFEPTAEIAARLRETAKLNEQVNLHIEEVAVADRAGYATLRRWRGETGDNEGMNYITMDELDSPSERVPTISLDEFCQDRNIERVDLLKMDIQGQEHLALQGAARLLRDGCIGTIFMELNWANGSTGTCPATASIRLLEQAGYRFCKPGRTLKFRPSGAWVQDLSDVIASHPSGGIA